MINFSELRPGNYVEVDFDGKRSTGVVTNLNNDEKQISVQNNVQDFWYDPKDVYPIILNDNALMKLNFSKEKMPDGTVKYKKGVFRLVIPAENDFSRVDMWYRDDVREHPQANYIHQLQNLYEQMTKVHLTNDVM